MASKKSFVSDIEQFWRKMHDASGVKNCKLFEGVRPSSCNLARRVMNPKIDWGASKIRLFTSSSSLAPETLGECRSGQKGPFMEGNQFPFLEKCLNNLFLGNRIKPKTTDQKPLYSH